MKKERQMNGIQLREIFLGLRCGFMAERGERGGAVDNVKKKLRYSIFETKKKIQSFYSCVRLVKVHFIKGDWIG